MSILGVASQDRVLAMVREDGMTAKPTKVHTYQRVIRTPSAPYTHWALEVVRLGMDRVCRALC
jgi:hypothetical protein